MCYQDWILIRPLMKGHHAPFPLLKENFNFPEPHYNGTISSPFSNVSVLSAPTPPLPARPKLPFGKGNCSCPCGEGDAIVGGGTGLRGVQRGKRHPAHPEGTLGSWPTQQRAHISCLSPIATSAQHFGFIPSSDSSWGKSWRLSQHLVPTQAHRGLALVSPAKVFVRLLSSFLVLELGLMHGSHNFLFGLTVY